MGWVGFGCSAGLFRGLGWVGSIGYWVGLGWITENGPTSMSGVIRTSMKIGPHFFGGGEGGSKRPFLERKFRLRRFRTAAARKTRKNYGKSKTTGYPQIHVW